MASRAKEMKEASGVNVPDVALEDIALFFGSFLVFLT